MPPPRAVEVSIGEERRVFHAPVGISVCPELDVDAILAKLPDEKLTRQATLAYIAWQEVRKEYGVMWDAINTPGKRGAAYTQPWLEGPAVPLDQWL